MKNNQVEKLDDKELNEFITQIKKNEPLFLEFEVNEEILLNKYNYILTKEAKDRLNKLYTYISEGVPVLLEGETGCSKTLSAEVICKYIYDKKREGQKSNISSEGEGFIKYNLSAEVKINDLIKKFIGNKNSLSGLKIVEGPFLKAFKEGIPFILDEINLASEEILQCIEGALDSGEININISGIGTVTQKKKEGFCLIATQNPNKGNYKNKRQNLSKSFLSHFQIIKFPSFEIKELKEIARKLFLSFNNNKKYDKEDIEAIDDLINFHKEWTSLDEVKDEIICFTIREIVAAVKAYIDENKTNLFKIVKVIYASRYTNDRKQEMLKRLEKYYTFKKDYYQYKSQLKYKNSLKFNIPGLYENIIINEVIESALFSLEKKRNIIIVGNFGAGKSYISREISKLYNSRKKRNKDDFYHFICTEETKCSDLIGYISPRKEKTINEDEVILEWKEGFLSNSIENGKIVILDNLQEADSTITERLNGLLDIKYDENKKGRKFDIPENPDKSSIIIHDDFRIIGVCDSQNIMNMSPAFLNRFDIIVLENQLENINYDNFKILLKILLEREEELESKNKNLKLYKDDDNFDKIVDKLYNIKNYYDKEQFSIINISRFCYSLKIFLEIEEIKNVPLKNILDFLFDLLFSEEDININKYGIKEILLKILKNKIDYSKIKNQFIFEGNEILENYILVVYVSFIIHLNLCIIGPPGVGKTSSAIFISEILRGENKYKLFNFHRTTKPNHLYGTIKLKEGKIEYYKGPLMESTAKGYIFIADEMNLSSISTMKSILPVLNPQLNKNILIPGFEKPINIEKDFFFISCQNDVDTFGRNNIPENIQRKLRIIKYPEQKEEEIKNICKGIRDKEFSKDDNIFSEKDSENLGSFMVKYNEIIDEFKLPLLKWSFRDINKIMKRISEHLNDNENFINFKFYHFIYFYLFSSISKEKLKKKINYIINKNENKNEPLENLIHDLFVKTFELDNNDSQKLKTCYFAEPTYLKINQNQYKNKGKKKKKKSLNLKIIL